jgi:hypothetical protein
LDQQLSFMENFGGWGAPGFEMQGEKTTRSRRPVPRSGDVSSLLTVRVFSNLNSQVLKALLSVPPRRGMWILDGNALISNKSILNAPIYL